MTDSPPRPRIFLIGFNKCGTTSFHEFFRANGIPSIHWRANTLAMTIHRNLREGSGPLLEGLDRWTAYTDMVCIPGSPWGGSNSDNHPLVEACRLFRELHRSYPGSLFILNTRDPFAWVRSRLGHDQGRFAQAYLEALRPQGIDSEERLVRQWLIDWHEHHGEVLRYFQANDAERFLLFHIGESAHDDLFRFLEPHFPLQVRSFPHRHRSDAAAACS